MKKTLLKAWNLLSPKDKGIAKLVLVLFSFLAIAESFSVFSILPFLTALISPEQFATNKNFDSINNLFLDLKLSSWKEQIVFLAGLSLFTILSSTIFKIVLIYYSNVFIENLKTKISGRLLRTYLNQKYTFFLQNNSSDLSKTILSETDQLIGGVYRQSINFFSSASLAIILLSIIFAIDYKIAISLLSIFSALYFGVILLLRRNILQLGEDAVEENKKRFIYVNEAFGGIKILKLLKKESFFLEKFRTHSYRFSRVSALYASYTQIPNFVIESLIFTLIILTSLFIVFNNPENDASTLIKTIPLLGLYGLSVIKLKPAVQSIYTAYSNIKYSSKIVENMHREIIQGSQKNNESNNNFILENFSGNIELENISFSYENQPYSILENVSLTIEKNETIGIIGNSGSGKTTLVDVILGLLIPNKGNVKIDNHYLIGSEMNKLTNLIGYVPQETFLSDCSIAENIAFGVNSEEIEKEKIISACKLANIHEFIENEIPEGYNAMVGERGVRLSGGQRQRIGIARALYFNPQILILDEATSSLDTRTEDSIMNSIAILKENLTIIIIAHRTSTLKICDKIYEVKGGKILIQK